MMKIMSAAISLSLARLLCGAMAFRRGVVMPVALALALALSASARGAYEDALLAAADEEEACPVGDEACGLSLRQLRGEMQAVEVQAHAEGPGAGDRGQPQQQPAPPEDGLLPQPQPQSASNMSVNMSAAFHYDPCACNSKGCKIRGRSAYLTCYAVGKSSCAEATKSWRGWWVRCGDDVSHGGFQPNQGGYYGPGGYSGPTSPHGGYYQQR